MQRLEQRHLAQHVGVAPAPHALRRHPHDEPLGGRVRGASHVEAERQPGVARHRLDVAHEGVRAVGVVGPGLELRLELDGVHRRHGSNAVWRPERPGAHDRSVSEALDLDHIAVAAWHADDLWPRYVGDLGGATIGGGPSPGFDWAQVGFANGMTVEGLEPARVDEFDFLQRFLDRHGPGPHHLTFKVPDLEAVLAILDAAGIQPARVDRSDPRWQEAFLFPADACGIVVQLAQQADDDGPEPLPADIPSPAAHARPGVEQASLDRIVLAVADRTVALRLYRDLLDGTETGEGVDGDGAWVDLRWPGPGRIRLLQTGDVPAGRTGYLHHLAFTTADPAGITDAAPGPDGTFEVPREQNLGVRLRLSRR